MYQGDATYDETTLRKPLFCLSRLWCELREPHSALLWPKLIIMVQEILSTIEFTYKTLGSISLDFRQDCTILLGPLVLLTVIRALYSLLFLESVFIIFTDIIECCLRKLGHISNRQNILLEHWVSHESFVFDVLI